MNDLPDFQKLGKALNAPSKELEFFPAPANVSEVRFMSDELTSFCPVTNQPDFNTVEISYRPNQRCVESKSLKLYLWTFRDAPIFGEALASTIAEDLFSALEPQWCKVVLQQNIRGGLQMSATAELHGSN